MAGSVVGQAIVQVRPNLAPFKRDVEQGVSAAGRKVKPIDVKANTRPAEAGFGRLKTVAASIAGIFAVSKGVEFFKGSIDAASDLNESLSKTRTVFGNSSREVERFASTAASKLGTSRQAALEATATFGNLLTALKLSKPAAADMSTNIVKLGSDLASFNNVKPEEAIEALRSGLVGETEPLRRFGVNINQAALQTEALKLGLIKTEKEALTPAAKAQAAYALIMEQTKTAQGDFARTSGGLANQQRILAARMTDLKARIGGALLPVVLKVVGVFNRFLDVLSKDGPPAIDMLKAKFAEIQATMQPFITRAQEIARQVIAWLPSFQQVVAFLDRFKFAILAAVGAFTAFRAAVGIINAVRNSIALLNAVLLANPIVLVGIAIAALAAAFVIAYQRSAQFRAVVQGALQAVQQIAQQVVTWFQGTFLPALRNAFNAVAQTWQQNSARIIANARSFLAFLQQVWSWFKGPATTIVRAAFTAISTIIRAQITIIQNVIQLVLNVLAGRWGAAWGNLKNIARTALTAAIAVIRGLGGAILSAAGQLAAKALQGIRTGLSKLPGLFTTALGKIPGLLSAAGSAAASAAISIGSSIITGILSGLGGLYGRLKSKLESDLKGVLSSLNPFSPVEHGGEIYIGRPLVEGVLKGVDGLSSKLKGKLSADVKAALQGARENLAQGASGLASTLNSFLDAKLANSPAGKRLAAAQDAQKELDFGNQRDQLQATIDDTTASAEDRAKAQADLEVLLAQHAFDLEQKKEEAAKASNERQLEDLAEALNRGLITQKQYQEKVTALLKSQGATYKAVGDALGLAFADGFLVQLRGMLQQAQAVAKGGVAGFGSSFNVTDARDTLRSELRDAKSQLADARKSARDKSGPGGTKITAGEQRAIDRAEQQVATLRKILNALDKIATAGLPADVKVTAVPDSWLQVAGETTGDAAR